jgi:hypothetical protein
MFLVFVLMVVLLFPFLEREGMENRPTTEEDTDTLMNNYNLIDDTIQNYTDILRKIK